MPPRRRTRRSSFQLLDYDDVLEELGRGRSYLLLGNGFSIACDPVFRYESLYDAAVEAGLSERAHAVFDRLGTNNFEGVMRLLDDTHWVASEYGLVEGEQSEMLEDLEIVKRTLVRAIASSHLDHTGDVPDEKKASALEFLDTYHGVFTTNYDLLLYWVVMHRGDDPPFRDGFASDDDDPDAPYLVFSERLGNRRGMYYLHGALHLYLSDGEVRKRSWIRTDTRLTELVRRGLEQGEYPLFVAEGSSEKKLAQIQRVGYLWYALDKLARIQSPLVVFGHSFGGSDQHVADTIARNRDLPAVFVGLHGSPESPSNRRIQRVGAQIQAERERRHPRRLLEMKYFDSDSAEVWNRCRD